MKLIIKKNKVLIAIISSCIFVLIAPIFFTTVAGEYFRGSGEVGDAIAGTTAPIIGTLSALLIYFSFQEQIKANKLQYDSFIELSKQYENDKRLNYVKEWADEITNNIEDIYIEVNPDFNYIYEGMEAISVLSSSWYMFGAPNNDFFNQTVDDNIPEKLTNICQSIINLKSYVGLYNLKEYSFCVSGIPLWIKVFEGMKEQVQKIIEGKPYKEYSGDTYREYYLAALTEKKQKAFQILLEHLQVLAIE